MKRVISLVFVVLLLNGCVYPNRQTHTVDDRPSIYIVNPPPNAMLHVDGAKIGPADKFNGEPNILLLEPGVHHVEIREGDNLIRSLDVFLGEGTRREIRLTGGDQ